MSAQPNISEMRRDFKTMTDVMYPSFFKSINYEGKKLFLQHCPMAFRGRPGADWISNSEEIVNPYLGENHPDYKSSMLHCGEVKIPSKPHKLLDASIVLPYMKWISLFFFLSFGLHTWGRMPHRLRPSKDKGQPRRTISGYIGDAATGETLIGASLAVRGITKGISSNQYGFYSSPCSKGSYTLVTTFIGYRPSVRQIVLDSDTSINIDLESGVSLSQEVIVTARKGTITFGLLKWVKFPCPSNRSGRYHSSWVKWTS